MVVEEDIPPSSSTSNFSSIFSSTAGISSGSAPSCGSKLSVRGSARISHMLTGKQAITSSSEAKATSAEECYGILSQCRLGGKSITHPEYVIEKVAHGIVRLLALVKGEV